MSRTNPNWREIDDQTGFQVLSGFQRFNQRDEIYCRCVWDGKIRTEKVLNFFRGYHMPQARARHTDGFSQRDYAFRNAAWHVTNVLRDIHRDETGRKKGFLDYFTFFEDGWPEPYPFESDEEATADLRKVAENCR